MFDVNKINRAALDKRKLSTLHSGALVLRRGGNIIYQVARLITIYGPEKSPQRGGTQVKRTLDSGSGTVFLVPVNDGNMSISSVSEETSVLLISESITEMAVQQECKMPLQQSEMSRAALAEKNTTRLMAKLPAGLPNDFILNLRMYLHYGACTTNSVRQLMNGNIVDFWAGMKKHNDVSDEALGRVVTWLLTIAPDWCWGVNFDSWCRNSGFLGTGEM